MSVCSAGKVNLWCGEVANYYKTEIQLVLQTIQ